VENIIQPRAARYHRLFASNQPGDLLIANRPSWVTKKNLFDYDFTRGGHLEMAADMVKSAKGLLEINGDLDDDFIPWLSVDFGIAINHTFLMDMPVQFAEWTSWADHPLSGPDGYAKLGDVHFDPNNRWVRMVREVVAYWRDHFDGTYLFTTFGHYGPLDLANGLRGNQLFTDFYDYEDEVRTLLERCTEAIISFEEDLRQVCGPYLFEYGLPFWGAMAPRGAVFLSEDAMDLSGPNISREWGVPYSEQIRDHFGTIAVHHHMYGYHVQPVIAQEVQHSVIQISNDPNCPPAIDKLHELYQASGNNVLLLECSPEDIEAHLDDFAQIRAIIICCNADPAKAKRAVELVRGVSNIR